MTAIKNVKLYNDLGFNADYNHVIDFDDITAQNTYFDSKVARILTNANYNKSQNVLKAELSYDTAITYTYCSFVMGSKTFYYWIKNVELVNDITVAFNLELDPFQTFMFNYTLGNAHTTRRHRDRWHYFVTPILPTIKVPLQYYNNKPNLQTVYHTAKSQNIFGSHMDLNPVADVKYTILYYYMFYASTNSDIKLYMIPFTADNTVLVTPEDPTNIGSIKRTIPTIRTILNSGVCSLMGLDPQKVLSSFVSTLNVGEQQINYILEQAYPNIIRFGIKTATFTDDIEYFEPYINNGYAIFDVNLDEYYAQQYSLQYKAEALRKEESVTISLYAEAPSDGDDASITHEPAMFMKPFVRRIITDNLGNILYEEPDLSIPISDTRDYTARLMLDVDNNSVLLSFRDDDYLNYSDYLVKEYEKGVEGYTANVPLKNMPLISDPWLSYCLNQRTADRDLLTTRAIVGGVSTGLGLASTGLAMGGLLMAGGGISSGLATSLGLSAGLSSVGSTVTDIASSFKEQDVKEQKIQNEPSLSLCASTGGYSNVLGNLLMDMSFIELQCDIVTYHTCYNQYMKYGYNCDLWDVPDTKTRKFFDYIQVDFVEVKGSIPQDVKAQIETIYKSGVTIWHGDNIASISGIGDYTKENIERSLL